MTSPVPSLRRVVPAVLLFAAGWAWAPACGAGTAAGGGATPGERAVADKDAGAAVELSAPSPEYDPGPEGAPARAEDAARYAAPGPEPGPAAADAWSDDAERKASALPPGTIGLSAAKPRPAPKPTTGGRPGRAPETRAYGGGPAAKRTRPHAAEGRPTSAPPAMAAPALRAGRHDDNRQYNRFLSFLQENAGLVVYFADVRERLVVRTVDRDGKSLHNCRVVVRGTDGRELARSVTYADGRTQFFPRTVEGAGDDYVLDADCGGQRRSGQMSRAGRREVEVRFPAARKVPEPVPVDIAVVIDTTGSMQSQIDRLKSTLQAIHFQLTQLPARPDIRFSLVAYRDRGDAYVTLVRNFTADVQAFQRELDALDADGGGDTPEDLQSALKDAMQQLSWRTDAVRLGFVIADAVPHTDYGQTYTYQSAMAEALARGIKWTMVGAGGLPRAGEVIFRQVAQYTMGEYVFVTQSGGGDHEGGTGEASHHVGTNYTTENLDQAIVRIVRRELSYLTDDPKDFDDTIVANANPSTPPEKVLSAAVKEVLRQLVDYSALRVEARTPVAVVPVAGPEGYGAVSGYLSDELLLAASREPRFALVERDFSALAQEMKVQLSDLVDPAEAVPIGKMLGAELLVVAKLTVQEGGDAQLFARLVRVETGEILSVAKADLRGGVVKRS